MLLKDHHALVSGVITMAVLGLVMATLSLVITGAPVMPAAVFSGWACAFLINIIVALIIPIHVWAPQWAIKIGLKPPKLIFGLFVGFMVNLIYVTFVSFGMTLLNVGANEMLIPAWLSIYPIFLIVGFIVSFLTSIIAGKIADRVCKKTEEVV